jgi:ABC-type sugar transport system ATPase subunit
MAFWRLLGHRLRAPSTTAYWLDLRRIRWHIPADGHRIDHVGAICAMIFENYALYPHLTAFENIAMPLRARRLPAQDVKRRVMEIARMLHIEPLMARRPSRLSGGEKQRVGVARALVREPAMFLMDEPLGHLEAYLRVELRAEIRW